MAVVMLVVVSRQKQQTQEQACKQTDAGCAGAEGCVGPGRHDLLRMGADYIYIYMYINNKTQVV